MKVCTTDEMRNIDNRAIEGLGIPIQVLMESAGRGVVDVIEQEYGDVSGLVIVIICGKGNNGGDGVVVARYLANLGAEVDIVLIGKIEETEGATRANLEIAVNQNLDPIEVTTEEDFEDCIELFTDADMIVDAMLGTGAKGEMKGLIKEFIELINDLDVPIIAVDAPTGIDTDTGEELGVAVRAEITVTMALPKRGQLLYPGKEHCGDVYVVDIGFPPQIIEAEKVQAELVEDDLVRSLLPQRAANAHKGSCGHVFVLAGSVGYTGAAAMASISALRIGAGLVTLGVPASLNDAMEIKLTEVITMPLPETNEKTFSISGLDSILEAVDKRDVLILGPGISQNEETGNLVRKLVTEIERPMVVDADGLNNLVEDLSLLEKITAPMVLTPHPGEMGRLIGISSKQVDKDRIRISQEYAEKWNKIIVLKGAPTIIADPTGEIFINSTGNAGLASGGTGDVLTGMIGGLLAQGAEPLSAAICGVYLHGLAGDIVSTDRGEMGLIASDLIDEIPEAMNLVRKIETDIEDSSISE